MDGDGGVSSANATNYGNAFLSRAADMGCPTNSQDANNNDCTGYELAENLDFDTDGDGDVDSNDVDSNWTPIGGTFAAAFAGNNKTISNLKINSAGLILGLFGRISSSSAVTGLGLVDVDITSSSPAATANAGAFAGVSVGTIRASYATGEISQTVGNSFGQNVGGLIGQLSSGTIEASWSGVNVSSNGSDADVGGLAGQSLFGTITASYSVGAVSISNGGDVGGLTGAIVGGTLSASYAAGPVLATGTGARSHGISTNLGSTTVTASYWDTNVTGIADDSDTNMPEGKTTSELQSVTGYDTGSVYAD